jgi:sortase A
MKGKALTIVLILVLVAGLSLLLYPTVSNFWNAIHQGRVLADYQSTVSTLSDQEYERLFQEADQYNQSLLTAENPLNTDGWTDADNEAYDRMLSIDGGQVMGTLEIPKIDVKLPLYHGTDETVLQVGVGHIKGSSLPVGGESTHSVLSGHTGLPSAQLLTDLDQMAKGDLFYLTVLDRTLVYQVDQILVVEPDDISALAIVPGEDYVTLVTCTPYGINSHRLLVRGTRIYPEQQEETVLLTDDAERVNVWLSVALFATPVFLLCIIGILISRKRK